MRLPDIFEVIVAVLAALTVISAVVMILYRVTRGDPEAARLAALKAELESEKKS